MPRIALSTHHVSSHLRLSSSVGQVPFGHFVDEELSEDDSVSRPSRKLRLASSMG